VTASELQPEQKHFGDDKDDIQKSMLTLSQPDRMTAIEYLLKL
jgi:hypothetical protein